MSNSASTAAAIARCREAFLKAQARYIELNGGPQKANEYPSRQKGKEAFRNALPQLSTRQNILDFIACVSVGVVLEVIRENTSSKLIYAAHAALRALPKDPRPRKSQKLHPPGAQKVNRVDSALNDGKQSELAQ
ncbi:MAG TPA: hypothetical protein VME23_05145 [Terracidiphilus sp.]|nr:hypothetical protein [Terracidiphilus sp.]